MRLPYWIVPTMFLAMASASPTPAAATPPPDALEAGLLAELNHARTDTEQLRQELLALRPLYKGQVYQRGIGLDMVTVEGFGAVEEAVRWLELGPGCGALRLDSGLSAAARDLVREQGPTGRTGHDSPDGSTTDMRVVRHGAWSRALAENIVYGDFSAREVVEQMVIDDDVPDRGHRRTLFDCSLNVVGVGCGRHARYGQMCVVVFAAEFDPERVAVPLDRVEEKQHGR